MPHKVWGEMTLKNNSESLKLINEKRAILFVEEWLDNASDRTRIPEFVEFLNLNGISAKLEGNFLTIHEDIMIDIRSLWKGDK